VEERLPREVGPSGAQLLSEEIFAIRQENPYKVFFKWPIITDMNIANSVTEARDVLMSERTYLSGLKMTLQLCVAGAVLIANVEFLDNGYTGSGSKLSPSESYGIGVAFLALGLIGAVFVFLSYARTVVGYAAYESIVVTSRAVYLLVFIAAGLCLVTNIIILARNDD
jgi:uncharacterized membrane protein YidH (DUF202 family)